MAQAFPLNIITYCPMALHTYYMLMIHNFVSNSHFFPNSVLLNLTQLDCLMDVSGQHVQRGYLIAPCP